MCRPGDGAARAAVILPSRPPLRLKDVAQIVDGAENERLAAWAVAARKKQLQQGAQCGHQDCTLGRVADADAQILADARCIEMAHDHGTGAQAGRQLRRVMLRVAGKDEVGHGRQHLEAQLSQVRRQLLAAGDDGLARLLEIRFVMQRASSCTTSRSLMKAAMSRALCC